MKKNNILSWIVLIQGILLLLQVYSGIRILAIPILFLTIVAVSL